MSIDALSNEPDGLAAREALYAIRAAHEYLEDPRGHIPLDHRIGENDEGCTFCHAAAVLEGRMKPMSEGDY